MNFEVDVWYGGSCWP